MPSQGLRSSPEKVDLGKALIFDPRLSRSQLISCNSCHNLATGGVDLQATSTGHGWVQGGRNSPTVLNAGFHVAQFWDGRAPDLKAQAAGPIANPVEMAHTHGDAVGTLKAIPGYTKLFEAAFPDDAEPISIDTITDAIAVFEQTLVTPNAPFDQFLEGDLDAMTSQQLQGLDVFMVSGCAGCHAGALLGGDSYQPFGLVEDPSDAIRPAADKGREEVTDDEADRYAFKVPSLRNIELTPPYFHTGAVWSLDDAVNVMAKTQLGAEMSSDDRAAVVAFLTSLTGDQPTVTLPALPASTAGTPEPDIASD